MTGLLRALAILVALPVWLGFVIFCLIAGCLKVMFTFFMDAPYYGKESFKAVYNIVYGFISVR